MFFNKGRKRIERMFDIDSALLNDFQMVIEEPALFEIKADIDNLVYFKSYQSEENAKVLTFNTIKEFSQLFKENEKICIWKVNVMTEKATYYNGLLTHVTVDNPDKNIYFHLESFAGDKGREGSISVTKKDLKDFLAGFSTNTIIEEKIIKIEETINEIKSTYNKIEIGLIVKKLLKESE